MLEDLKPILNDLGEKLDQMRISLEIPAKEEKIAELEYKMSEPSFWDDAAAAQKLNQELAALKGGVDTYKELMAKYEDAETLYEMGIEENDPSMERVARRRRPGRRCSCGCTDAGRSGTASPLRLPTCSRAMRPA